jgi:hypothetical protein
LKPRACNNFANEADMIPLPSEDVTPPVTNIYFVFDKPVILNDGAKVIIKPKNMENKSADLFQTHVSVYKLSVCIVLLILLVRNRTHREL